MSWLTEPDGWNHDAGIWHEDDGQTRGRGKLIALIVGGWLLVSIAVLIGLLFIGTPKSKKTAAPAPQPVASGTSRSAAAAPAPTPSSTPLLPAGWVQEASDDQTDCAAHSYGQIRAFLTATRCSSVHRMLSKTTQAGRTVVVASYIIVFQTAAQAQSFNALVAADGTGNISDLLREDVTFPGAPNRLAEAAFASRQQGQRVLVAETAYSSGPSSNADVKLKSLARLAVNQV